MINCCIICKSELSKVQQPNYIVFSCENPLCYIPKFDIENKRQFTTTYFTKFRAETDFTYKNIIYYVFPFKFNDGFFSITSSNLTLQKGTWIKKFIRSKSSDLIEFMEIDVQSNVIQTEEFYPFVEDFEKMKSIGTRLLELSSFY